MNRIKYYHLLKLFSDFRKQQLCLLILSSFAIALNLYFVYQIQCFIDFISDCVNMQYIWKEFIKILIIGSISLAVEIYQNQMWHIFRHTLMNEMRIKMYHKLIRKKAVFYDLQTTGEIVSAVMNDGAMIAECAGINILMLFLNSFQVVIIFIVLIWKNMIMGFIVFFMGVMYFAIINNVNKTMRDTYKDYSQNIADVNQQITEDIRAILEIKTLNKKDYFEHRFFEKIWNKLFVATKKIIRLDVISYGVNNFISVIYPIFMVMIGGIFLFRGAITIGTVILYYTYIQKLIEPLNNLADFYRGTQMAVGAAERINEYLTDEDESTGDMLPDENEVSLIIDIDKYSWKKEGCEILNNIHEEYNGGDCILVDGKSGKGKSTLFKLICAFYPLEHGVIRINGQNVGLIKEAELFKYVKMQFQEPVILEGSLRENIALGDNYSDYEIMKILELVMLDKFAKENGLDYSIGESGRNLSGGQKQRIVLARVLIRKPRILILDEATNGLDSVTEEQVISNIQEYITETNSILLVASHKDKMKKICNKKLVL